MELVRIETDEFESLWLMPLYIRRINQSKEMGGCVIFYADSPAIRVFSTESADKVAEKVNEAMRGTEIQI